MPLLHIIGIFVYSTICSIFSYSLAQKKHYKQTIRFALIGFICGILGVIYVAGLPLNVSIRDEIALYIEETLGHDELPSEETIKGILDEYRGKN